MGADGHDAEYIRKKSYLFHNACKYCENNMHCDASTHTSFPFRERNVPSRLVLDKLDLDLAAAGLLVGLGLLVVVVVVGRAVDSGVVVDERVFTDGGLMWIGRGRNVDCSALTLAGAHGHGGGRRCRGCGLLGKWGRCGVGIG